MTGMFLEPFNFMHAVVGATTNKEFGRTVTLCGGFSLLSADVGLGHRFPSDFSGDNNSLCLAGCCSCDRLDGFDIFAVDVNAAVFVDSGVNLWPVGVLCWTDCLGGLAGCSGARKGESPYLVVIQCATDVVGGAVCTGGLLKADLVPCDRTPHGGDEEFRGFGLVGQHETYRVFSELEGLLCDVSYQTACIQISFTSNRRIGEGNDG